MSLYMDKPPSNFNPPCPFIKLAKMTMEVRHKRMLEEVLKLPGNETCADCHAPAPRWASVNLGIFLCVGCASVHRKMGTHKSRVKSVTLDTWTREQIVHMKEIGNIVSNQTFNPNEKLHPPPPSYGHDERDSEIEKYIRKKYELGVFKVPTNPNSASIGGSRVQYEPTSLNRARQRDGRLPSNNLGQENYKNPELNDIISFQQQQQKNDTMYGNHKERDLPALPNEITNNPPRQRPQVNKSVPAPWATPSTNAGTPPPPPSSTTSFTTGQSQNNNYTKDANLVDFSMANTQNATLPLQLNVSSQNQNIPNQNGYPLMNQIPQQQPQQNYQLSSSPMNGYSASGFPASQGYAFGTSPQYGNQQQQINGFGQTLSPQSNYGQQLNQTSGYTMGNSGPLTPNATPSPNFSNSSSFPQQPQPQFNQMQQTTYNHISPSFQQSSSFGQQPSFGQPQQSMTYQQSSFMPQQQQQQYMAPQQQQQQQQQQQWGVPITNGYMQNNGMRM